MEMPSFLFLAEHEEIADMLPSGHTRQLSCLPRVLVQGPDIAHHGLTCSLPLTLLLADEKCNSPSLVTSEDPAPGPTSDFFLESEPFERDHSWTVC